eukprot:TRINITY_DN18189_c0_g1_i1.p1 TRINITY_DN18189_c0_g1~~TRINITY_DN18189_c0_g1_i1.p1  ORF type:complete len:269 (-),score=38.47 TRINITY_DN18189_c0_g1_i1:422-1228(-)
MSLLDLPDELVVRILLSLSLKELCFNVCLVCHRLYALHQEDSLWFNIYNSRFSVTRTFSVSVFGKKKTIVSMEQNGEDIEALLARISQIKKELKQWDYTAMPYRELMRRMKLMGEMTEEWEHMIEGKANIQLTLVFKKSLYTWRDTFRERNHRGKRLRDKIEKIVEYISSENAYRFDAVIPDRENDEMGKELSFKNRSFAKGFFEDVTDLIPHIRKAVPKLNCQGMHVHDLVEILEFVIWADGTKADRDKLLERKVGLSHQVYDMIYM